MEINFKIKLIRPKSIKQYTHLHLSNITIVIFMNVSSALSRESKHCSANDETSVFCKKINLKAVSHIYIILKSRYIKKKKAIQN